MPRLSQMNGRQKRKQGRGSLEYNEVYDLALQFVPDIPKLPSSTWVAILHHDVEYLSEIRDSGAFMWAKAKPTITVRTLNFKYFQQRPLESLSISFLRDVPDDVMTVENMREELREKNLRDEILVLRAVETYVVHDDLSDEEFFNDTTDQDTNNETEDAKIFQMLDDQIHQDVRDSATYQNGVSEVHEQMTLREESRSNLVEDTRIEQNTSLERHRATKLDTMSRDRGSISTLGGVSLSSIERMPEVPNSVSNINASLFPGLVNGGQPKDEERDSIDLQMDRKRERVALGLDSETSSDIMDDQVSVVEISDYDDINEKDENTKRALPEVLETELPSSKKIRLTISRTHDDEESEDDSPEPQLIDAGAAGDQSSDPDYENADDLDNDESDTD